LPCRFSTVLTPPPPRKFFQLASRKNRVPCFPGRGVPRVFFVPPSSNNSALSYGHGGGPDFFSKNVIKACPVRWSGGGGGVASSQFSSFFFPLFRRLAGDPPPPNPLWSKPLELRLPPFPLPVNFFPRPLLFFAREQG